MQYLLSVPKNLSSHWQEIIPDTKERNYFVASDPSESNLGSGGGTAWLLNLAEKACKTAGGNDKIKKRIIIHAGGQSRRLPAYASCGKILTPIPVFRWACGQSINQNLLDLQSSLYEKLLALSDTNQNTLIASGDILLYTPKLPKNLPQADLICFGMWVEAERASKHGVFIVHKDMPECLIRMRQKPSVQDLQNLSTDNLFMMDIGIWILSDKAINILQKKCAKTDDGFEKNLFGKDIPKFYDLYGTFGLALGEDPSTKDADIAALSTAIVCLEGGEFYHYGTSTDLVASTEKIQNLVTDPRNIWHKKIKMHPSLFVQNAQVNINWNTEHRNIWIENSTITKNWTVRQNTIITGVPENKWKLDLAAGICLDITPILPNSAKSLQDEPMYCIRPYGYDDVFSGSCLDKTTFWLNMPLYQWFTEHDSTLEQANIAPDTDIQFAPIFPATEKTFILDKSCEKLIVWMIRPSSLSRTEQAEYRALWLKSPRLSAYDISSKADIVSLFEQRKTYCLRNLPILAKNHTKSVFYQTDLELSAKLYAQNKLPLPPDLSKNAGYISRMRDAMFRSRVCELSGKDGGKERKKAFSVLQNALSSTLDPVLPQYRVYSDQIVWGRSPVRIDIAGGWSDTPPFCNINGGTVLNAAVNLNDQQPIQVYVRIISEAKIRLRSIDTGSSEDILTYKSLAAFNQVGSVFSIPKAALYLCGFHPDFCTQGFNSLQEQLLALGGGLEISLLAAVPKGSGLGTSSILAGTVLGSLADACSFNWTRQEIARRTLVLEQLLTTGGGWQDQYGGIFGGLKLLESMSGMQEKLSIQWQNERLFTAGETNRLWILYYTGITRIAKNILSEIVQAMFLNNKNTLSVLSDIKQHAYDAAQAFQTGNYKEAGLSLHRSWHLNKTLDSGTATPEINFLFSRIQDYVHGAKLLGAGGGGYMLMCAKDIDAANRIQSILSENPPNNRARFVSMALNREGLQISRS